MLAEERQSAPRAQLSRRALFGAAAIIVAAPAGIAAATPIIATGSAADLYRRYLVAMQAFCAGTDPHSEDDEHAHCMALCYATLDAPIVTHADAAAKIRLACESLDSGELSNGKDVAAMEQVAAWLEAL